MNLLSTRTSLYFNEYYIQDSGFLKNNYDVIKSGVALSYVSLVKL